MTNYRNHCTRRPVLLMFGLVLLLSGCGFGLGFGSLGPEETPTATREERPLVPTFTPTSPPVAAPATEQPTAAPVSTAPISTAPVTTAPVTTAPIQVAVAPTATLAPAQPTSTPTATDTPAATAKLSVTANGINVRAGPGTNYGLVGTADANLTFDIVGKSPDGAWWQVCCVNGQQGWVFGELARAENAQAVPVAANIPAPPVAPTQAPAPPTQAPAPTQAPPPQAADPCANIGGDGCKFKLRDGPKFASNGGTEIKLQLFFIHSGVSGGQPQGSYFVVLIKDGQKLLIDDNVRSIANAASKGTLGDYNYEYKIGLDKIPGNNVAGNYVMYVLDGNGERDSRDLPFTIPEGQGEVWIKWDQG